MAGIGTEDRHHGHTDVAFGRVIRQCRRILDNKTSEHIAIKIGDADEGGRYGHGVPLGIKTDWVGHYTGERPAWLWNFFGNWRIDDAMTRFDPFRWLRDSRVGLILERLTKMSAASDVLNAKVDALAGKVDLIQTSLTDIRGDIADIKNGLPASGGMSGDEVAALSAKVDALGSKVDGVVSDAQELDTENPATPVT